MGERTSRPAEVVVRAAPVAPETPAPEKAYAVDEPRPEGGEVAVATELLQDFDVLVFTKLELPNAGAIRDLPEDVPRELAGLPLAAVERVTVNKGYFNKYVSAFVRGEKAAATLLSGNEIFKEVSPGLEGLLKGEVEPRRPLRVWWSIAAPGFTALPWELLAYRGGGYADGAVSFVRGLPPSQPVPRLPAGDKLRLAFIHGPSTTPPALAEALRDIEGIELIDMKGHPLDALQEAIRENYELIHLVSDGSTSIACEGYLHLHCPGPEDDPQQARSRLSRWAYRALLTFQVKLGPSLPESWNDKLSDKLYTKLNITTLSASQLSALQRGSQLAVLSLSPPSTDDTSDERLDGMFLPGVFSAFAYIGSSSLPMPNIVAQLGAGEPQSLAKFWRQFYTELARSLEVEKSARTGLRENPPLPVALFLRQQSRQTFKRQEGPSAESVPLINAELQQLRETVKQLKELEGVELGEVVAEFEQRASTHQRELQAKLDPWLEDEEEGLAEEAHVAEDQGVKGAANEQ